MRASTLPDLPPIPAIPAPMPVDSVPMSDSASAAEVRLDLPITPGPFEPTWESIEKNYPGTPAWLREAKFGIWVHFGPQAAGQSGDWYARHLYKPEHIARKNHLARYGHPTEVGYKDVLREWNPAKLDPAALAALYREAGARFLFVQGVHHDQYDMWDSRYQPWNSTRLGAKRDLVGEWARAARAEGLRFGVTFHHEYSWWWWQTAFMADREGPLAGVPYDGHLTLADGIGKWWEGMDPRLLYGIDLREYAGVSKAALSPWSPPPAGIFGRHADFTKWYATWWALRMMDVVEKYDPDFIYTDGTGQQPFSGRDTGTGLKADAMQRVIADFYNRSLARRGKVDTFSIVKFRHTTNGTVNTEEFGVPAKIKTDQAWIAEAPVGDWFYSPDFYYDPVIMIRYVIEATARDGAAAICISPRPDGSLEDGCVAMLKAVGDWMRRNGDAIYGSKAWVIPGEGEIVNGKLKMIPGGKLGRAQAEIRFGPQDFRFTVGKDGALYATCLTVPASGTELRITSLGSSSPHRAGPISKVTLLGHEGAPLVWNQTPEALVITCPDTSAFRTAIVFRVE